MFEFAGLRRITVAAVFYPMFQVSLFSLFGADFVFLPLWMCFQKFGKFGIGYRIFVKLEGLDFNKGSLFFEIERAITASFDFTISAANVLPQIKALPKRRSRMSFMVRPYYRLKTENSFLR